MGNEIVIVLFRINIIYVSLAGVDKTYVVKS